MAAGADRGYIDWTPNAALWPLVDDILTVVNFYSDGGYPAPTVRDVYYDLLGRFGSTRGYQKGESFNRKVYRLLRKMRRSQMIGFDQVDDDSSNSLVVRTFVDPDGFWADVDGRVSTYQKDLTVSQPKRVKIFTEGKGAVNQFYEVAKDYAIPVYSPGGWDSLDFKHETAISAVYEYEQTGRQTVVLHAGDFDPDGVALFGVFCEDVWAFVDAEIVVSDPEEVITFERVMLHADQVPPANRISFDHSKVKAKDYRGKKWPHDWKAELQALGLVERLDVMRTAIEAHLDRGQLQADRAVIADERASIRADIAKITEQQ